MRPVRRSSERLSKEEGIKKGLALPSEPRMILQVSYWYELQIMESGNRTLALIEKTPWFFYIPSV
jgi:hypothetical protein